MKEKETLKEEIEEIEEKGEMIALLDFFERKQERRRRRINERKRTKRIEEKRSNA